MGFWWDFGGILVGFWWDFGGILVGFWWDFGGILVGFWWDFGGILVGKLGIGIFHCHHWLFSLQSLQSRCPEMASKSLSLTIDISMVSHNFLLGRLERTAITVVPYESIAPRNLILEYDRVVLNLELILITPKTTSTYKGLFQEVL